MLIQAVLTSLGDGLFFSSHEADMVHLADLVLRQSAGEVYHLDIATPIGGWATLPMALLHRAGLGLGAAMTWGQIVAAVVFLPALVVVTVNRFTLGQAALVCLIVIGLSTGLVAGGTEPLTSLSMHYNRWCWAATLIVALTVLLPGTPMRDTADGVVIGVLMVGMAMIKVSYPVALALPVIFGLLRNGRTKALLVSIFTAFIGLLLITLVLGLGYWQAYLGDLLTVAGSAARAAPGADWPHLVISPVGIPSTLVVVAVIYFATRLGRREIGAMLLLFFAAFTVITWQNFGNDPLWLCVPAALAWVLSSRAQGSAARGLRVTAVAAGVLILPVVLNILWSPIRHVTASETLSRPLLPQDESLRIVKARGEASFAKTELISPPDTTVATFRGEDLPTCELSGGLVAKLEKDTAALMQLAPDLDRQPLAADLFQAHWIFAGLRPLKGGAPWYYDELPGIADATHVMIPDCPADLRARDRVTELLEQSGLVLEEVGRAEGFALYRIVR
ncbi:hypothetical protein [Pseudooceanicola sp.]|uniref:hypothetical protein n=1 Tax=Pseudooceanicola sp. TaxID=1914328 RepID=UPI0035C71FBF